MLKAPDIDQSLKTDGTRISWTICAIQKIESHMRHIDHPKVVELLDQFNDFVMRLGEIDDRFVGLTSGNGVETEEELMDRLTNSCELMRLAEGRKSSKLEAYEELCATLESVGAP